jgi:hypothetical protein
VHNALTCNGYPKCLRRADQFFCAQQFNKEGKFSSIGSHVFGGCKPDHTKEVDSQVDQFLVCNERKGGGKEGRKKGGRRGEEERERGEKGEEREGRRKRGRKREGRERGGEGEGRGRRGGEKKRGEGEEQKSC